MRSTNVGAGPPAARSARQAHVGRVGAGEDRLEAARQALHHPGVGEDPEACRRRRRRAPARRRRWAPCPNAADRRRRRGSPPPAPTVRSTSGGRRPTRGGCAPESAMAVFTQPGHRHDTPTPAACSSLVVVQALGDADDGPLARRVGRVAGEVTGHRRGVDDVPVAVLDEVRQERPVTVDDAPQVDARAPSATPSRSTHSPPDIAPATPALLHSTLTRPNASIAASRSRSTAVAVGDVGRHADRRRHRVAVIAGDGLVELGHLDVGEHHVHPGAGEALGERPTHPRARARHHRCLAVQVLHGPMTSTAAAPPRRLGDQAGLRRSSTPWKRASPRATISGWAGRM